MSKISAKEKLVASYEKVASTWSQKEQSNIVNEDFLDGVFGRSVKNLTTMETQALGVPTLQEFDSQTLREATLEAQARLLDTEASKDPRSSPLSGDDLRALGATNKSVNYGYEKVQEDVGFWATKNRRFVHASQLLLKSRSENLELSEQEDMKAYQNMSREEVLIAARTAQKLFLLDCASGETASKKGQLRFRAQNVEQLSPSDLVSSGENESILGEKGPNKINSVVEQVTRALKLHPDIKEDLNKKPRKVEKSSER